MENIVFLDDSKVKIEGYIGSVCDKDKVSCFWDRNPITDFKIYCPIKLYPTQLVKQYISQISKEEYTIKENISYIQNVELKTKAGNDWTICDSKMIVCDVFCSFSCCLAWIEDNIHNPLYDNSRMLLLKHFKETTGKSPSLLSKAPSWRLLKEYGGDLSIEDFRAASEFKDISPTKYLPIGSVYEKCSLFSKY